MSCLRGVQHLSKDASGPSFAATASARPDLPEPADVSMTS